MITPEVHARIRRLFFAEHWKIGTIAAELGVHPDTVRRAIESEHFNDRPPTLRSSILDPFKPFISEILERHPRLRSTRIYQMIRDRGYPGSVVQLRRYVHGVRPAREKEAYLRLQTLPGEQAQVDWANFGKVRIGNATRNLSCFVLVLSWSRALYARFALDQTLESFLRGHVEAFHALGVARVILYDNLKCAVLERIGDHIRFHPRLLELAGHYHFAPRPCAPRRGNEKGRVERTIQYLRHSFFAARSFSDIADLNRQLAAWIAETAHARKVPGDPQGRIIADALEEERSRMLPLPEHDFDCDHLRPVAAGKTPYVRFEANDYSIPHNRVGKVLTLIASEQLVRLLDGTLEVARHLRSYDRGRTIEDPAHLAALAREKRRAHESRGRDRLRGACPHAEAFIDAIALRGEPMAGHCARLLKLLDRYGAPELNAAIQEALSRGAISAASVAHILDRRARSRQEPPPLEVVLPDDPRVRDLRVTPHPLAPYDHLCSTDEPDEDRHEPIA